MNTASGPLPPMRWAEFIYPKSQKKSARIWNAQEPRYSCAVSALPPLNSHPVLRQLPLFALLLAGCAATAPVSMPASGPAAGSAPPRPPQLAQLDLPTSAEEKILPLSGAPAELSAPVKPLSGSERASAQMHVMTGELAAGRKQPELAAREFLAALDLVDDADLAQRATALALVSGNSDLALRTARKWLALEPNEMDPREVIARFSLDQGDLGETLVQCEAIVKGHAGGEDEGMRHVALLLAQAGQKSAEASIGIMQKLVAARPKVAGAHQALGILALRFNRLDLAERSARKAQELAPETRDHALLLAGVLVREDKLEQADAIFEGLIAKDKNPAELRLGYAKVLLEAGKRDAARVQTRKALEAKPGYADALYALGVMAYNDRNYDEAESSLKQVLDSERTQDAAFQLGRVAEARKDYTSALSWYERVSSGNQAIDAAIRRGYVLVRLKRIPEAQDLMLGLRQTFPQLANRLYLAEADMLTNAEAYAQAMGVFDTALKEAPEDADLLYARSLVFERQQKIDEAEKDLRAILKHDGEDARAMNALGYMLVVHTKRLDEARKLIARALELEPDDAAILDSVGWVQYKLGKPQEARELLRKALDKLPDPEVAAHLGEVLWKLGDKEQAKTVWNEALKENPEHRVLNETVKRLTQ